MFIPIPPMVVPELPEGWAMWLTKLTVKTLYVAALMNIMKMAFESMPMGAFTH